MRPAALALAVLASTASLGPALADPAASTGTIRGRVAFTGKAPTPAKVKRDADPYCARTPETDASLVVNKNGTLKNVLVRISSPVAGTFAPPAKPVVVTQQQCVYQPRVQTAVAGQSIEIRNADRTLHNVHAYDGTTSVINTAQPPNGPPVERTLKGGPTVLKVRCDVHPWMIGYVSVTAHPFAAVTGDDGAFEIKDIPAGAYKLEVWHETLGTKTIDVTVAAGQVAQASASYTGGEKP